MATTVTPCAGDGIGVNAEGQVAALGPRPLKWRGSCDIDQTNGLYVDESTGKMWVPPQQSITRLANQPAGRSFTLGGTGSRMLAEFKNSISTKTCAQSYVDITLADGFTSYFLRSGDWWIVRRQQTVTIDGEETHNSERALSFLSPPGVCNIGIPMRDWHLTRIVDAGSVVEVTLRFYVDVLANSGDDSSHVDVAYPNLAISAWSFPL